MRYRLLSSLSFGGGGDSGGALRLYASMAEEDGILYVGVSATSPFS